MDARDSRVGCSECSRRMKRILPSQARMQHACPCARPAR